MVVNIGTKEWEEAKQRHDYIKNYTKHVQVNNAYKNKLFLGEKFDINKQEIKIEKNPV